MAHPAVEALMTSRQAAERRPTPAERGAAPVTECRGSREPGQKQEQRAKLGVLDEQLLHVALHRIQPESETTPPRWLSLARAHACLVRSGVGSGTNARHWLSHAQTRGRIFRCEHP
jgi:hypothetical protein